MTSLLEADLRSAFLRRVAAAEQLGEQASRVAAACEAMAERFLEGGTLLVFGSGPAAADAAHVAVEFVHPVIVGKRALPAISLTADIATVTGVAATDANDVFAAALRVLARPEDIALALTCDVNNAAVARALGTAHEMGLLTVALAGPGLPAGEGAVDHLLTVESDDPQVVKEVHVTTYHVLWELVHVFLEQPGNGTVPT